jgi:dihydropteroate synthase
MMPANGAQALFRPGEGTRIFGILNLTPDSFSDGGQWNDPERAVQRAAQMAGEGAVAIDLGGESTRPGHAPVSAAEELRRVLPVIERLAAAPCDFLLSIDTTKAEVARAALAAGAGVLNDVSGFQGDPALPEVAAAAGCPVILMHRDRGFSAAAGDPLDKIKRFFDRSLIIAAQAEVTQIILDPGIGFHKTPEESLEIMGRLAELKSFGRPLLQGASRKSVLGQVLDGAPPADRLEATLATSVWAAIQGVEFVRVHDVLANARALRMAAALQRRVR